MELQKTASQQLLFPTGGKAFIHNTWLKTINIFHGKDLEKNYLPDMAFDWMPFFLNHFSFGASLLFATKGSTNTNILVFWANNPIVFMGCSLLSSHLEQKDWFLFCSVFRNCTPDNSSRMRDLSLQPFSVTESRCELSTQSLMLTIITVISAKGDSTGSRAVHGQRNYQSSSSSCFPHPYINTHLTTSDQNLSGRCKLLTFQVKKQPFNHCLDHTLFP